MRHILTIGIGRYRCDPQLPNLPLALSDYTEVLDVLTGHWLPSNDVTSQSLPSPKRSNAILSAEEIREMLDQFSKPVTRSDSVVVYWAGHLLLGHYFGSPDTGEPEPYFASGESDPQNPFPRSLRAREVIEFVLNLPAQETILILDICYGEEVARQFLSLLQERFGGASGEDSHKAVLAGCRALAHEADDLKHGVFTYHLLKVLRGDDGYDDRGTVTLGHAYRYVAEKVPETARLQLPLPQRPTLEPLLDPKVYQIPLTLHPMPAVRPRSERIVDVVANL